MNTQNLEKATQRDPNKVNVFISYKADDVAIARAIKKELGNYSGGKVDFFIASDMVKGQPWGEWIKSSLAQSHVLILVFTDPNLDFGWCLFEAGLFLGLDVEGHRRVICIYAPQNGPPRPLESIQGVRADKEDLQGFLVQLFHKTEITRTQDPLGPDVALDTLGETAARIAALFVKEEMHPEFLLPEIIFCVPNLKKLDAARMEEISSGRLPADTVVQPNSKALDIFGLTPGSWSWSDLLQKIDSRASAWSAELARAVISVADRTRPPPMAATFRIWDSGKIFRPILHRVDYASGLASKCYFVFNQEISPAKFGGPSAVDKLFNALRLHNRYRWEAIDTFSKKLATSHKPEGAKLLCIQLYDSWEAILYDARSQGLERMEEIISCFSEKDHEEILNLTTRWSGYVERLMDAVKAVDLATIKEILEAMCEISQRIIRAGAKRYSELLVVPGECAPAMTAAEPSPGNVTTFQVRSPG